MNDHDPHTVLETGKRTAPNWRLPLRLALTLLLVTAAAAGLCALFNAFTADTIALEAVKDRHELMTGVMPGADVFSTLYSEDPTIDRISGAYAGTTFMGYCVEVSPRGFAGDVSLLVGIEPGGSVTGVAILEHRETPGMGANAQSPAFLDQYLDKSGSITVNEGRNAVSAITSATITSQAVTDGVNTALTAVFNYSAQGGQITDEADF